METKRSLRREVARIAALAESRRVRLGEVTTYAELLRDQKRRLQGRHDDLLNVVAVAITARTSPEQLREAMHRAGFRAELQYALLDLPENTRPTAKEATA